MSSWKWLPNPIFLICLINLFAIFRSEFPTRIFIKHEFQNNRNGTSNITYKTNLNTLLSSVSSNIDTNGFYNASIGENSDRVNVIALCRADLQPYQCRDYVKNATAEIIKRCPNQDQAILWHEFCMVRYSNEAIYGTLAYSPFRWSNSKKNVRNPEKFYSALNILLDSLRNQTAYNSSAKKFAAASRAYEDYQPIYAFEQCTPDITPKECDDCVTKSAQQIRECCDGAAGVRILRPSCYLRFESDVFYNETMAETLFQPPTPPVQPPQVPAPATGKENNTTRIVIIVTVPIVISLILALSIGIFLRTKKRRKPWENIQTDNETSTIESLQYDFGTIRTATDNFSDANKLGQGGFGVVYKGKLPKGNEIAVKRLSRDSRQGELEFKNEVLLVARLQHRNLVRLLGFSVEGSERLLIYEWVENGSLDRFIFDQNNHPYLDWEKRYVVIVGISRGLLYLHEDSRLQIIHRDLKASNILLDEEMNPKISDFGMAKLFVPNETHQSTSRIVGTYGYMAPEYIIHGQFSVKSDVFSFGILVLEIICGRKTSNFRNNEIMEDLLSCVWKNWNEGTAANIIDPVLRSSSRSLRDIMRCIHIGLLCVQENAADRPTMSSVVLMLSSFSLTLSVPSQPAFFVSSRVDSELSVLCENDSSKYRSDNTAHLSANDVSMSDLYPR